MLLRQATANLFRRRIRPPSQIFSTTKTNFSYQPPSDIHQHWWSLIHRDPRLWFFLFGNAAIFVGINTSPILAKQVSTEENLKDDSDFVGLRKIEDGSVISNIHTSKWRVFTDYARDMFLQGKLKEAEQFFLSALEEAKQGFGERDPHVASSCNNLAELYRVNRAFDKAEPLYLQAIDILEQTFGPEDIRVGSALHNLGQFYLVQRKLEEAHNCYERAVKIKGRVLGHNHVDYADTMYHLGMVLYLRGKNVDAEALVLDSVRILEESGQAESTVCVKRLRYLAQIYLKTNRVREAENVQRKILHILELTKGWNSLDTVIAAEGLALTLESAGSLKEAQELIERCLNARKTLLPEDHIQIGANWLHIARLAMLNANWLRKMDTSKAIAALEKAKDHLNNSVRIAENILNKLSEQNGKVQGLGAPGETRKNGREALVILLQSYDALGLLEITKKELQDLKDEHTPVVEAGNSFFRCISAYKKFGSEKPIHDTRDVKTEYLSCLKHLASLIIDTDTDTEGTQRSDRLKLNDIKNEIKHVEAEVSPQRRERN
ncbi:uncharacterized protein LOC133818640 isoform X3 [Humulus lupulus]|uniref:uncharacterized protein LOC133818640 isoform X3 n=1 Tax=Humulus lupulus TaxID=3486 RepID=UPI002B40764B|nr:uncharacterized protein LOC133818640 isoform X3 [Humulus lupulus]